MPLAGQVLERLERRTPSAPLTAARVALGLAALAACFETWRSLSRILAPLVVPLPYVAWVPRLPMSALPLLGLTWSLAAAAFTVGFRTRLAGASLTAVSLYAVLLDQRTYSNHLYLLALLVLLLTLADAGAAGSLDARRNGTRPTVAAWPVFLIKAQASFVYGFSALAKLTPDFLSGAVLSDVMRTNLLPGDWRPPALMAGMAVAAVVVELFVAVGLWVERVRWPAIAAGIGLHAAILLCLNSSRLSLLIFAVELIGTYPLFVFPGRRRVGARS